MVKQLSENEVYTGKQRTKNKGHRKLAKSQNSGRANIERRNLKKGNGELFEWGKRSGMELNVLQHEREGDLIE